MRADIHCVFCNGFVVDGRTINNKWVCVDCERKMMQDTPDWRRVCVEKDMTIMDLKDDVVSMRDRVILERERREKTEGELAVLRQEAAALAEQVVEFNVLKDMSLKLDMTVGHDNLMYAKELRKELAKKDKEIADKDLRIAAHEEAKNVGEHRLAEQGYKIKELEKEVEEQHTRCLAYLAEKDGVIADKTADLSLLFVRAKDVLDRLKRANERNKRAADLIAGLLQEKKELESVLDLKDSRLKKRIRGRITFYDGCLSKSESYCVTSEVRRRYLKIKAELEGLLLEDKK